MANNNEIKKLRSQVKQLKLQKTREKLRKEVAQLSAQKQIAERRGAFQRSRTGRIVTGVSAGFKGTTKLGGIRRKESMGLKELVKKTSVKKAAIKVRKKAIKKISRAREEVAFITHEAGLSPVA